MGGIGRFCGFTFIIRIIKNGVEIDMKMPHNSPE